MNTDLEVFWTIVTVNVCYCTNLNNSKKVPSFQNLSFQLYGQAEGAIQKSF